MSDFMGQLLIPPFSFFFRSLSLAEDEIRTQFTPSLRRIREEHAHRPPPLSTESKLHLFNLYFYLNTANLATVGRELDYNSAELLMLARLTMFISV